MASVGFGVAAAVAPASSSSAAGRRQARRSVLAVPAATRGGPAAAAKEEQSLGDFIFGLIFKKNQLLETDPLLNKVDGNTALRSSISGAKTRRGGTTAGKKAAASDDSGGFNLGGLFAKKD